MELVQNEEIWPEQEKDKVAAPSSSKFNPKRSCVLRFLTKKTSTFDDFSLCFYVSDKKHKEKSSKVDVFLESFGWNFEDEGAKIPVFSPDYSKKG